ncbi:ATP-binding protein [Paraburkholderia sp. BCC1886]|uniref:ATP-binding protein n=1 Tax=Paraburkholderia sp. BCC1886 TaxID=2562670 RepID=UPI0011826846|nr:ATP-binding protein [Paraburkholderia sp. BCC1886]
MQKILDRTQESLAQAFAALAQSAKRQRRMYLATIASLMLIVVIFALVLAVVAGLKQLEYRRTLALQSATDISLLLQRQASFLRRAEFTLDYYDGTEQVRGVPAEFQQSIEQRGAAHGTVNGIGAQFDLLVGEATRAAWGAQLGGKLGRLYEAAQSTLVTQQAFELRQRALLIGLTDDYAAILPALAQAVGSVSGSALNSASTSETAPPPPQAALVTTLRATLESQLERQTGKRWPARGELVWLGPYRDPLQGVPVISAVSAYYRGGQPTALIVINLPLDELATRVAPADGAGATLLMSGDRRIVVASSPLTAPVADALQRAVAITPFHVVHYGRLGASFHEPLRPGFGMLVGWLSWSALIVALDWQLATIACLTLLILLGIAVTARVFGLRLLQSAFAETSRALESETLNHILVSATPVGLCIVRQSDYSILTANALATGLLRIEPGASRLPLPIVGEFLAMTPERPSAAAFAQIAAFVVPAPTPAPNLAQHQHQPPPSCAAASDDNTTRPRFLQFTYAPARYDGESVLFCAILDVTAQHALEQQLRDAQRASEAMMRARTNFFAAMSHEIRTPLNALLGNLELFARTPGLDAHAQRLATLGIAANALRRVVDDILDFSKIDAGEMLLVAEPFSVIDEFENIALAYAPMHGNRAIRFYALLSPTLERTLIGDRMRIAQIANNLLSNAFKFTSSGKITLQAHVSDDVHGGPTLSFRVADSGTGMSENLLARLFKPFVQGDAGTSRGTSGTGLGLVICARLCELMGGRIAAESVVGVGSAFQVTIPLAGPPGSQQVEKPARRGSALVLCQEKEAGVLLNSWLDRYGWVGHSLASVASAQSWLQANRPALMIVSGEYDLDAIASLRAVRPLGAVWITRAGPHRPERRADGVLEVSAFNRGAFLSAIEAAVEGGADASTASAGPTGLPAASITSAASAATTADPALRGLAILVAEDNPLIQSLIVEQLAELGCVPTIGVDGQQALSLFEQTRFDVVLTDIHMPVMDGYELLAALRRRHPDTQLPVLAFSAVTESEPEENWSERGFSGYVAKPASLAELQSALLAAVAGRDGDAANAQNAWVADARPASVFDPDDKARYVAMLKEHLRTDLPRLLAIVDAEDLRALAGWLHSASGAFLVVKHTGFVDRCQQLQALCRASEHWSAELDEHAVSLHDALCEHYGLDD